MTSVTQAPSFCEGIQYFGEALPGFEKLGKEPAIASGQTAIAQANDEKAVFQTMLAVDALRYLILHVTASKSSGHPGGFASQAEAYAALVMLGCKNILTEVGHYAPGFYSAMFLDRSLEYVGISTGYGRGRSLPGAPGPIGPGTVTPRTYISGFVTTALLNCRLLPPGLSVSQAIARHTPTPLKKASALTLGPILTSEVVRKIIAGIPTRERAVGLLLPRALSKPRI